MPQVGLGIPFDGEPPAPRRAPPGLGADADEVLETLAYLVIDADRAFGRRTAAHATGQP